MIDRHHLITMKRTYSLSQSSVASQPAAKKIRFKPSYKKTSNLTAVVKRVLRNASETKELNTYTTATNASGGYSYCINQIAEGDDDNQRSGRNVQPKHVYVDYWVSAANNIAEDPGFVALVWDKQPNQTAATFGTIFDTTSATPGLALRLNLANKDRFQVLWLEPFVRQAGSTALGNSMNIRNRKFAKLPLNYKVEFGGTAAAVPSTGACLICMGSNTNSGTTTSAQFTYNARFAYNDY